MKNSGIYDVLVIKHLDYTEISKGAAHNLTELHKFSVAGAH